MIHRAHDVPIFQVSETTNLLNIHSTLHSYTVFLLLLTYRWRLSWDVWADAHVTCNKGAMLENMTKQMPWSFHDIQYILLSSNVRHCASSKVLEHTACLHLWGRTVLCHKTEGIYIYIYTPIMLAFINQTVLCHTSKYNHQSVLLLCTFH